MAEGVIALTPRQVLLRSKHHHSVPAASSSCAASIMTNNNNNEDDDSNKIGGNVCLLHSSIANYFKYNGFSKSLKSFLKESSSLQKDDLQDDSINLEHIYSKYLEACDNSAKNVNKQKEKVPGKKSEDMAAEPVSSSVKYEEKKKGKRNSDSVGQVVNSSHDNILRESPIDDVNEYKNKNKKKKKNKSVSESVASRGEQHPLGSLHGTKEEKLKDHASSEQKGETDFVEEDALKIRKKKSKRTFDSHVDGVERGTENLKGTGSENLNDIGKSTYNGSTTDKKGNNSKKRKSHSSKENGLKLGDGVTAEKSKCNITEDQQNPENVDQPAEENATLSSDDNKCKGSSERVDLKASKKTPIKELDGQHNGKYENSGQKSASQRTSKKQHESSAEPKTVNVFQRVKVDEVVITDERLKDNSYWAKDGANSGYGAKAQGILGQVRGRDFRHEKTKKKRGSYRGGQIDLQAHSIKFNNSDEDV